MAKYLKFKKKNQETSCWGKVDGENIRLLSNSPLAGGKETEQIISSSEIRDYLPPADPVNLIAIGANYAEHCREGDADLPDHPLIFTMLTTTLAAHAQPVILPREAPSKVDYEAELVAVIGKTAKNISETEALDYVFGYSIGNDISARDCQLAIDQQWARGKSFDTFAPVGPYLVTDIDPQDLEISLRLNGQTLQQSRTSQMIFKLPFLISYLSRQFTLLPGTLIFTGTPSGVGFSRKPQIFLKAGDVCEVEIEGVGILRNTIVAES